MEQFVVKKRKTREYEQFTCRIDEKVLEEIKDIVLKNNLESINAFINECIKFALKNLEIEEDS